ncbi:MAG TPA: hypothetical protein EYP93_00780 [Gammaproteobacteria bacterium]|nr:hypothetical protein [Gammaproteobacteria bacterium]
MPGVLKTAAPQWLRCARNWVCVHVIARFNTLIEHLRHTPDLAQHLDAMEAYRARYGESQP